MGFYNFSESLQRAGLFCWRAALAATLVATLAAKSMIFQGGLAKLEISR
jgi:hypothetical protein